MRSSYALLLLALSIPCSGCALFEDASRNCCVGLCSPFEAHREQARNRRWANEAWQTVCCSERPGTHSEHYAAGFKEGFAEYLFRGGDGEPPLVAPARYRHIRYQTADGYRAVQDWFAGYRHGAALARESGARRWITGPSALETDPYGFVPHMEPHHFDRLETMPFPEPHRTMPKAGTEDANKKDDKAKLGAPLSEAGRVRPGAVFVEAPQSEPFTIMQASGVEPASTPPPVAQPVFIYPKSNPPMVGEPLQTTPKYNPPVVEPMQTTPKYNPPAVEPLQTTPRSNPPVVEPLQTSPKANPPVLAPLQPTPKANPPVVEQPARAPNVIEPAPTVIERPFSMPKVSEPTPLPRDPIVIRQWQPQEAEIINRGAVPMPSKSDLRSVPPGREPTINNRGGGPTIINRGSEPTIINHGPSGDSTIYKQGNSGAGDSEEQSLPEAVRIRITNIRLAPAELAEPVRARITSITTEGPKN